MELSLGRRAEYAIRATLDLARHHGGQLRKARQIGAATEVPPSYLPQILAQLVRAEIACSVAGPRGGYGLQRAPADVSLLDVILAVEERSAPATCVLRGGPCHWEDRCAVHEPWSKAQEAMAAQLSATTFADLTELAPVGSSPPRLSPEPGGPTRPPAPA